MAKVLLEYEIEFIEIPRAEIKEEVIVRELIKQSRFEKIKDLFPYPSFKYFDR